jgi:hypothetical protein
MALAREILEGNEEYVEQHQTNGEDTTEADDGDATDVEASSEGEGGVTEAIGEASDADEESPPADDFSL